MPFQKKTEANLPDIQLKKFINLLKYLDNQRTIAHRYAKVDVSNWDYAFFRAFEILSEEDRVKVQKMTPSEREKFLSGDVEESATLDAVE